jgi:hypothetical protein
MARSYKKYDNPPQSEDYNSQQSRTLIPREKKASHHRVRNDLKKCDSEIYIGVEKKYKFYCGDNSLKGNIPNKPFIYLNETLNSKCQYEQLSPKWKKEDGNLLNCIDNFKTEYIEEKKYINATKKQIERRGAPKLFKSHLKNVNNDLIYEDDF